MKFGRIALLLLSAIGTVITSVPHLQCTCSGVPHSDDAHWQPAALSSCCARGCCGSTRLKDRNSSLPCCRKESQRTCITSDIPDQSGAFTHVSNTWSSEFSVTPSQCFQVIHIPSPVTAEKIFSQLWQSWMNSVQQAALGHCLWDAVVRDLFSSRLIPHRHADDGVTLSTDLVSLHQRLSI